MKKIIAFTIAIMLVLSFGVLSSSAEEPQYKVEISTPYAVFTDGDFLELETYINIVDNTDGGKDWIGIYPEYKNGREVDLDNITMDDSIGWWTYVNGQSSIRLEAENLKLNWSTYEFEEGTYYVILFENDGYGVLAYSEFTVYNEDPEEATASSAPTTAPTAEPADATTAPTAAPTANPTAEPTAEATQAPKNEGGCGGAIGGGLVIVALAAAVALRKKEN